MQGSDNFGVDSGGRICRIFARSIGKCPFPALPHRRKRNEGSREGRAWGSRARLLLASRLRRHHADDRYRQQQRHDPHAEADGRFHQGQSRHQAQLGHARRERAAPEGDDRHRHQGRTVRRADHRHLRNADLGQEGLAGAARQARRRLRRRRPVARDSRRALARRQALRRAVLRRELLRHVPHRPDGKGRPQDAGEADLGLHQAGRRQDDRQGRRRLRHLPARQARLGREHGVPDRDRQLLRRALVRREVAAAVQFAGMEGDARLSTCR